MSIRLEWQTKALGELAKWSSGGTPNRSNKCYYGGSIPWLKTGDLGPRYVRNIPEFITEEGLKNSSAKLFPKGSVGIAMYGATIGKVSIILLDAACNQACAIAQANEELIDREFLYYLLKNEKEAFTAKGKGGAQPNISQKIIKEHEVKVPDIEMQQKVVEKLDLLLAKVEAAQARLDKIPTILKRFRQSVLAAATSGELTKEWREENNFEKPSLKEIETYWEKQFSNQNRRFKPYTTLDNDLNEFGWLSSKLGSICDVHVGSTPKRTEPSFWNGEVKWVSSSEVAFCEISETKETITTKGLENSSTKLHPSGTVMLAMIGQGKTRGQPAILRTEACHNQNTAALRIPEHHLLPEFLYYLLWERYEETRKIGGGNNQKALNKTTVQSIDINLPSLEEQRVIVHKIEQLFVRADTVEKQYNAARARLDKLTQSILAKAFRGELVS